MTTLDLSPTEAAGPSQIGSLTVRLAVQPNDEPAIKGKQRILSELKEDAGLKLADKRYSETESSGQVSTSSDLSKSLNRILSALSAMSNIADAASKVCYILSLRIFSPMSPCEGSPHCGQCVEYDYITAQGRFSLR